MKTFCELFCTETQCGPDEFKRHVFWLCLHWTARPVAPLILQLFPHHFETDWTLIASAGQCRDMGQLEDEIRDFSLNPANEPWLRRVLRLRVSTSRLRRLARRQLGQTVAGPQPASS